MCSRILEQLEINFETLVYREQGPARVVQQPGYSQQGMLRSDLLQPVIYQRSHRLGSKTYNIQISEDDQGLIISAEDPISEKVLSCTLQR
jgi:hypothetical protein